MAERQRSARALRNDERIRAAIVSEILRVGVDRVSLRDVGRTAGLTHGATYARFEDADEMLVDAWENGLGEQVAQLYDLSIAAVAETSDENIAALAGLIAEDTPGLIAGLHILLLSRRNPIVGEVVDEFIMTHVRRRRGDGTYTAANPSGLIVFSMVIVHLFINTFYKVDPVFMANGVSVIRHMIAARTAPPDLTQIPPLQPAFAVPLDSLRARLSDAAFHVVGKSGFQLATVSRIARKAGVAASSIYKIYDSKEELIADCYLQAYRFHWMRLINFVHVLEPGVLSTMMSTALRDSNKPRREFALEFAIASAHNETLKKAAVKQMADLEDIIPDLDLTEAEEIMLRQLIRFLTYALIGINMIEVLSGEASSWPDLVSFGESLRLGLLHGREETWAGLREKMLAYDRRVNSLTSISS